MFDGVVYDVVVPRVRTVRRLEFVAVVWSAAIAARQLIEFVDQLYSVRTPLTS